LTQASIGSDRGASTGLNISLRASSSAIAIFANDQWLSALPSGRPSSSHILCARSRILASRSSAIGNFALMILGIDSARSNTGSSSKPSVSGHKPKNDRWLKRHPNVRFHFTPTRASWLNQVEIWFSILQGQSLNRASFKSVKQLRQHIDDFVEAYNADAKAFVWTKSEVHQKRLKPRFADQ
jgi:hypothetical protein